MILGRFSFALVLVVVHQCGKYGMWIRWLHLNELFLNQRSNGKWNDGTWIDKFKIIDQCFFPVLDRFKEKRWTHRLLRSTHFVFLLVNGVQFVSFLQKIQNDIVNQLGFVFMLLHLCFRSISIIYRRRDRSETRRCFNRYLPKSWMIVERECWVAWRWWWLDLVSDQEWLGSMLMEHEDERSVDKLVLEWKVERSFLYRDREKVLNLPLAHLLVGDENFFQTRFAASLRSDEQ